MLQLIKNRPGFGLLEAVIASGIIVVLSSITVGISHVVITNTSDFDNKIVASNLAESGIEAAYSIRDNNLNDSDPSTGWDDGLYDPVLGCNEIPNLHNSSTFPTSGIGGSCGLSASGYSQLMAPSSLDLKYISKSELDPQVIQYNNTDFVREIFMQKDTPTSNILNIRSIVFLKSDRTILADVSTQLTNWKDTDSSERNGL